MYESFGAVVKESSVTFKVFFPDNTIDPNQYERGDLPHIKHLRVTGTFQSEIKGVNWDFEHAPTLTKHAGKKGWIYEHHITHLNDGFYEYKYFVEFENGTSRWCSDPCTKYGGFENENSGFVVGGNKAVVKPIKNRLPVEKLIIYEVMLDDFTHEYNTDENFNTIKAPFDAFRDKLDYVQSLGVNAVEFMPWTTWPKGEFSWGYDPVSFFSVEYNYYNDDAAPLVKLYRLQQLINDLHDRDIHVIMDGVYNHANDEGDPNKGFAYKWLYQDPTDSPYIGSFGGGGFFSELDFANTCVDEFINDVCNYWINEFGIDGIRFDYVGGYYVADNPGQGIGEIISDVKKFSKTKKLSNLSLLLELLTDPRYAAIAQTNNIDASGCWFDPIMWEAIATTTQMQTSLMRALHSGKDFTAGKYPVTYLENHDHSTLTEQCGGREKWWVTQPMVIALFTICGVPFIHNGQEFGEQYWMPEKDGLRVMSRPLRWEKSTDGIGTQLLSLYKKLIAIRRKFPVLSNPNFYPDVYDLSWTSFNPLGYGVDIFKGIVIYHRWGTNDNDELERFIIALNFSNNDQIINIPFPENGTWQNLLAEGEETLPVQNYWAENYFLHSHWGVIYKMM